LRGPGVGDSRDVDVEQVAGHALCAARHRAFGRGDAVRQWAAHRETGGWSPRRLELPVDLVDEITALDRHDGIARDDHGDHDDGKRDHQPRSQAHIAARSRIV
jgi:hypothetical protein